MVISYQHSSAVCRRRCWQLPKPSHVGYEDVAVCFWKRLIERAPAQTDRCGASKKRGGRFVYVFSQSSRVTVLFSLHRQLQTSMLSRKRGSDVICVIEVAGQCATRGRARSGTCKLLQSQICLLCFCHRRCDLRSEFDCIFASGKV